MYISFSPLKSFIFGANDSFNFDLKFLFIIIFLLRSKQQWFTFCISCVSIFCLNICYFKESISFPMTVLIFCVYTKFKCFVWNLLFMNLKFSQFQTKKKKKNLILISLNPSLFKVLSTFITQLFLFSFISCKTHYFCLFFPV